MSAAGAAAVAGVAGAGWRRDRRRTWVLVALAALALGLGFLGLCMGDRWSSPREVLDAVFGIERNAVIARWRLARVSAALLFGAALGLSGAIFQTLTRNELGSPDVIGLDSGAYTGVLLVMAVAGESEVSLTTAALAGGLAAAIVVYALSVRGGALGLQLIVIGVAVNAMLIGFDQWVILRADLDVAASAVWWSAGSLNGIDFADLTVPLLVVAVGVAVLVRLHQAAAQATLGDEVAVVSGVRLGRHRLQLLVVGVALTAVVTAAAGPVAFVALAAPQVGRRLVGSWSTPLLPAALTGAVLLLASDLLAQRLLRSEALPVGVVTTAVGGSYLLWLLAREVRSR